jgi:hypothetical protein
MDHAFGEVRRCSDQDWSERFPRGQRVLDDLPGDRVGGRLKALSLEALLETSSAVSVQMEMSVSDVAMIP